MVRFGMHVVGFWVLCRHCFRDDFGCLRCVAIVWRCAPNAWTGPQSQGWTDPYPRNAAESPLLMRTDSAVRPVVGDDDFDVEVAGDGQLPTRFRSLGKPPLPQNATRYWAAFLAVATRTAEFRVSG